MRKSHYERELNRLIDDLFCEATNIHGWNWQKLANRAGLSYTCVYRLGTYQTRLPQLRTIILLCKALGYTIELVQKAIIKKSKAA
jgi:hypothetical protein